MALLPAKMATLSDKMATLSDKMATLLAKTALASARMEEDLRVELDGLSAAERGQIIVLVQRCAASVLAIA
eukprot:2052087-Rhodomonas_salina.5